MTSISPPGPTAKILFVFLLTTTTFLTTAFSSYVMAEEATSEKCYGIAKAGMNDCANGANSCSGTAQKDKQRDAYILLPKGLCSKIVDGKLTPS